MQLARQLSNICVALKWHFYLALYIIHPLLIALKLFATIVIYHTFNGVTIVFRYLRTGRCQPWAINGGFSCMLLIIRRETVCRLHSRRLREWAPLRAAKLIDRHRHNEDTRPTYTYIRWNHRLLPWKTSFVTSIRCDLIASTLRVHKLT